MQRLYEEATGEPWPCDCPFPDEVQVDSVSNSSPDSALPSIPVTPAGPAPRAASGDQGSTNAAGRKRRPSRKNPEDCTPRQKSNLLSQLRHELLGDVLPTCFSIVFQRF